MRIRCTGHSCLHRGAGSAHPRIRAEGKYCRKHVPMSERDFCVLPLCCARFGAQFEVPMPDADARKAILRLILANHAAETQRYNGSTCVDTALLTVRTRCPRHLFWSALSLSTSSSCSLGAALSLDGAWCDLDCPHPATRLGFTTALCPLGLGKGVNGCINWK